MGGDQELCSPRTSGHTAPPHAPPRGDSDSSAFAMWVRKAVGRPAHSYIVLMATPLPAASSPLPSAPGCPRGAHTHKRGAERGLEHGRGSVTTFVSGLWLPERVSGSMGASCLFAPRQSGQGGKQVPLALGTGRPSVCLTGQGLPSSTWKTVLILARRKVWDPLSRHRRLLGMHRGWRCDLAGL